MVSVAEKRYTLAEFLALPEDIADGCELVDGHLVKKHIWDDESMGMTPEMFRHAQTVRLAWRALDDAAVAQGLGMALSKPLIDVGANRDRTRRPDIAVFAGAPPTTPDAIQALVPALAVEVISPNNTAADALDKVVEYLAAGTQLVWQMFPRQRIITATWPDRTAMFHPGDVITAEPVLSGFACPVTDLFPPPPQAG